MKTVLKDGRLPILN